MTDPPDCARCGDSLQDPRDRHDRGNRWREKCMDCIEELAYSPEGG